MKSKTLKRIAALMCAATMMLGLAACGGKPTDQPSDSDQPSGGSSSPVVSPSNSTGGAPEAGTLTIWFMNEGTNYQKAFDKFEELTKDTLNTHIDLKWTIYHKTEMPLKFGGQEACDITFDAYWLNMQDNTNKGYYADISSYLNNDEYPGIKKIFTDDIIAQVRQADGAVYALPLVGSYNNLRCIFLRGDWREKYGLAPVTDEESFLAYLEGIEAHKDELGITATVGLGNRGYFYMGYDFFTKAKNNVFEIDNSGARATQQFEAVLNEDGTKVISVNAIGDPDEMYADNPAPYNTNYRNELVQKLSRDFGKYVENDAINIQDLNDKFYSGQFAVGEGELGGFSTAESKLKAACGDDAFFEIYFYDPEVRNMESGIPMNASVANNFIVFPSYSQNLDRAMKFINWIYESQENYGKL